MYAEEDLRSAVKTSVDVSNNNESFLDYSHPDGQTQRQTRHVRCMCSALFLPEIEY